jgi:uncharacterized cupredoxin-like copper-binding protein
MTAGTATIGGWRGLPLYTRVAIAGLLVYAALFKGLGVLFWALGEPFLVIFASILAARYGKWAVLGAGIWATANMLLHSFNIVSALSHVDSFFDFGVALPITLSLIVAAVAGYVAFAQQRTDGARMSARSGERTALAALVVVTVVLMSVSRVMHLAGLESVSAADMAGAMLVSMKNAEFVPVSLQVATGDAGRLVVKNGDLGVHTFTIDKLGVDVTVLGGSEKLVELPSSARGTYEYVCKIPGHETMTGTLVLQ